MKANVIFLWEQLVTEIRNRIIVLINSYRGVKHVASRS